MTPDDIIKMAKQAGLDPDLWNYTDAFERFAALVAAHEREACAKVCEETTASWTQDLYNSGCTDCAAAIRARVDQ
jgi:hypothetical protein